MGTQQALTTKQLEVLTLLYSIEEFTENEEAKIEELVVEKTTADEMLTCSFGYEVKESDEILTALIYYGYVDESIKLTIDGKQYIALFMEDLQKKVEAPTVVINNQFSLLNIDELNAGINTKIEKSGGNPFLGVVAELTKSVIQAKLGIVTK